MANYILNSFNFRLLLAVCHFRDLGLGLGSFINIKRILDTHDVSN